MTSQTPPPYAPGPQTPGPAPEDTPPGGPGAAQFFDRIRAYGAVRPDGGRWAAGVAAGLARRWGLDPLLVRGVFVVLALFGGVGFFLYGLGWLLLPHPDGRIHAQEVMRGVVTAGFIGGVLCVLADAGGNWGWDGWDWGPHPFGGGLVGLALVVLVVWWFARGRHGSGPNGGHGGWGGGWGGGSGGGWGGGPGGTGGTGGTGGAPYTGASYGGSSTSPAGSSGPAGTAPTTPTTMEGTDAPTASGPGASWGAAPPYGTPPAPTQVLAAPPPAYLAPPVARTIDRSRPLHALTVSVLGLALLAAGGVLLWDRTWSLGENAGAVALAVALAVVALGVLVAGVLGRRSGGLAPIGILLAIVTAAGASAAGDVSWAGNRTWTPGTVRGASSYSLAVGNGRLDLTSVSPTGATAADPAELDVRMGIGNLTVVAPKGVAVRIVATTGAGNAENRAGLAPTTGPPTGPAQGRGQHADLDVQTAPDPVLVVHADLGAGNLVIVSPTR